jgi:RNase H-fold protein (predicted Holliday junction resolvase)
VYTLTIVSIIIIGGNNKMNKKIQPIDSNLSTKAAEELKKAVSVELTIEDPPLIFLDELFKKENDGDSQGTE